MDVFSAPRTQLAGTGSAGSLTTSDVFVFDNITTDIYGNPIDVVFNAQSIDIAGGVLLASVLDAIMDASQNANIIYSITLVKDGTATPTTPFGETIDQSSINGVIVQQTDVDSVYNGHDSSDVVGFLDGNPTVTHFNTVPLASYPTGGTAIALDPAKVGNKDNWKNEINENPFDNYVTYEFETLAQERFIHGFTGTSTELAQRGSGILLCAINNVSAGIVARDDDFTATPINTLVGGSAGQVLSNDTVNGSPASALSSTLKVLVPATPKTAGALVPVLTTTGAQTGQVPSQQAFHLAYTPLSTVCVTL